LNQINLYEAIFKRKSVRNYDLSIHFDKNEFSEILSTISKLKPMYDNIKTEIKIVRQKDVKSLLPWKAPYYVMAFSETKKGYLTNLGFILQQLGLFFSAKGLGSCWQGWPKPIKEIMNASNLEFVIAMAFGKTNEQIYRKNITEFKRKPLNKITNIVNAYDLIEPVRIAPTTMQPWFFTGSNNIIDVYCKKSKLIKVIFLEKYTEIEMGIGLCHLWIAAGYFNKKIEFTKNVTTVKVIKKIK